MDAEVVVVGGGIGGLTVGSLLAQRGLDVCLVERESVVGGCVTNFEKFGYTFEPGYGLYAGWESGEIHDRIFSELPVDAPEVRRIDSGYAVRLPDGSEISLSPDRKRVETDLRVAFPECAEQAVEFYRKLEPLAATLRRALRNHPDFLSLSKPRRTYALLSEPGIASQFLRAAKQTTLEQLQGLSSRFQRFIDVQLTAFAQASSANVSFLHAALVLTASFEGLFGIRGGGQALAERLALSIRESGGRVRLNTPALRLAYDASGNVIGVDLLTGETLTASKAVISNLTLWDTYGKLVGLNRTQPAIRQRLKSLRSWGAYFAYLGVDESIVPSLPSTHLLALNNWQEAQPFTPEGNQLFVAAAPSWDQRAPRGKRAVTVHAFTDVEDWFTFHADESEHEEQDRQALEDLWQQLHRVSPDLASNAEVIETATPRTIYEQTRRKLGMVGGIPAENAFWLSKPPHTTSVPNLYIVSDTTYPWGLPGISNAALALANAITPK